MVSKFSRYFPYLLKAVLFQGPDDVHDPPNSPLIFTHHDLDSPRSPMSPFKFGPLPRFAVMSGPSVPDMFRRQSAFQTRNTESISASTSLVRPPDRFLPARSPLDTVFEKFHVNKDIYKLSASERLLRRDIDNDIFNPRRRATISNTLTGPTARSFATVLRTGGEMHDCA